MLLDRAPGTSSLAQMCLGLSQAPSSETPGKQSSPLCVPSKLIERILALNENVVRVLISIIQMSWGVNPSFTCSVDNTNMILARLLSFLSLLSARLDQALPPDIRLDLFFHSSRFQAQPPFNDVFIRNFCQDCSAASARISHLSLRWCKRISALDGISFILQSHLEHLVSLDLSHSLVSDEVLVPFFARNPPRLESIDLQSTIIGIETVIAMHQFTTCRAPSAPLSLRSIDLRNCQQLFFEQFVQSQKEVSMKIDERTQLLVALIQEIQSLNIQIQTSSIALPREINRPGQ